VGDEFLTDWIQRFSPDFVLSGHIHNAPFCSAGSWIDRLGNSWVFNVGRQIGPQPTFVILDLEAMTARWIATEDDVTRDLTSPTAALSGS
jgi:Icc-related predicted phosphoesterase